MGAEELRSRAGQLLYRELPEEYRYRDPAPEPGELGDLEAFLHGFGHLLDLIRGTTEQAYADAFAEPVASGREIQPWLIPYLAELVAADLRAPDPAARRQELNQTVSWYKSKGSLRSIDEIADVVCAAETVLVEGWRRTLTTPRLGLPPFTAPPEAMGDGDPMQAPGLPQGTPDLRHTNRALADPGGADPLHALRFPSRDAFGRAGPAQTVYWRPSMRRGAPCAPGAFSDTALRTPDLRSPDANGFVGPHPARTLIHVRPPEGFFATGLNGTLRPSIAQIDIDPSLTTRQSFGPEEVMRSLGMLEPGVVEALRIDGQIVLPERLIVTGNLTLPPGTDIAFEGLIFTGALRLTSPDTRLQLSRCAVERLVIAHPTETPALRASDCLFNSIRGGVDFAELVCCTVLEDTQLGRLWASDCLFVGPLVDLSCSGGDSCIRYSRVPDLGALAGCAADKAPSNTDADPNFLRLWFEDGAGSVLRPAQFGEPGAGVLDLTSSEAIRAGAEDEGEMGAHHFLFHAARIRALERKLTDYLPLGQEIAIRYDPHLSRPPVQAS